MINSFSPKFEILSPSGLTWLTAVDQALEKLNLHRQERSPNVVTLGFLVGFELHFPKILDASISPSLATGILRTEIQRNKYLICKF